MRSKRTELETMVSEIVVKAVIETDPGLRDVIREALDQGTPPGVMHRRLGIASQRRKPYHEGRYNMALTVDWLIDEWERDKGLIKADESMDRIEDTR